MVMTKTGVEKSRVLAQFHFIYANPKELTRARSIELIHKGFEVAGVHGDRDLYDYDTYVAFIEDNGSSPDTGEKLPHVEFALPGSHFRTKIQVARETLADKHAHEAQHYRNPDHTSTRAPEFLTARTLVLIIGGREFLGYNAYVYLERNGFLRETLIELILSFSGIGEDKTSKAKNYIHCTIDDPSFYSGNFDEFLQRVRRTRMSSAELMERLEES